MPEAKRHHYVPQFYLRRFSDSRGRIRVYRAGTQLPPFVTSTKNAAVESGFYDIVTTTGATSTSVEEMLAGLEASASRAIAALTAGRFPPDSAFREVISTYMAFQILRSPESRRAYESMVDFTAKLMLEGMTAEQARARAAGAGDDDPDEGARVIMDIANRPDTFKLVPHQNEHIQIMLNVAGRLSPALFARSWALGATNTGRMFITSDHPIALYSSSASRDSLRGVGLVTADEIYFPLDRRNVLILAKPGRIREDIVKVEDEGVLFVNHLLAESSYKFVYQHPEDPSVQALIPSSPRPIMEISGKQFFGD